MTKNDDNRVDIRREEMLKESITKLVVKLAVPTTIIQIISVIYNTADTYFVAHLGKSAVAAVGVGFSLMSIIQAIGMGFGMGAGSLISRELGAKKESEANKNGSSALAISVILATIFSLIGIFNIENVMKLLGSSDSMLQFSCDYAKYIFIGCPIMCAALVLNTILRAEGSAKYALFGITAGGVLNVILDPILIYKVGLGISGAAIATSFSQLVSCIILILPFLRKKSVVRLNIKFISTDISDYVKIIKTGLPTICRQGLASIASALLNRKARMYGDAAIAGITIANKVYLLVRNVILGIGQGYQPIAGYNYGAGNNKRTRQSFIVACGIGTVISTVASIVIFIYAKEVVMWFQADEEVVEIGKKALYFACAVMPFMAYSTYVNQLYQCLGFSKTATILACNRQGIMFIPAIIILPQLIQLTGVEMAQPLADLLSFVVSVPYQIVFFRKELKVIEYSDER